MSRLIDADKLKKHYAWWNNEEKKVFDDIVDLQPTVDAESLITRHEDIGYERGYRDGYAEALEVTDDVEPVKHGHWVGVDDEPCNVWECDVCGWIYEDDEPYYNFCPHCGAKMDVPDMDVGKKEVKE